MHPSNLKRTRGLYAAFRCAWALVAALGVSACDDGDPVLEAEAFVVHVSPTGVDTADGSSPEAALLTLQAAHDLLQVIDPPGPVHVEIAPGQYHLQQVVWNWLPVDGGLSIRWAVPGERPIFDGCGPDDDPCPGGAFLTFELPGGALTGVEVEGLQIERYQRGVYFLNDREDPEAFSGGNRVADCVFSEIGNAYNLAVGNAFGAVTFVNSRENVVEDNDFERLLNFHEFNLLHAVYLAHHSDDNIIRGNTFDVVSGDAVRVRDSSDRNVVEGNLYIKAGYRALSEWYCSRDLGRECTKTAPECPSYGNLLIGNAFDGNWPACGEHEYLYADQDDIETGCPPLPEGVERLEARDNTLIDPSASACEIGLDPMERP